MSKRMIRSALALLLVLGLGSLPTAVGAEEVSGDSTVSSVDAVKGTLRLAGGTTLLVLPTTRVVTPEGDKVDLADVDADDEEPVYYEGTERAGSVSARLVIVGGAPD